MSAYLHFYVPGIPAPQGSKKAFVVKGHAVVAEASKKLPAWRDAVVTKALQRVEEGRWVTLDGPVHVSIDFLLPRPKSVQRQYPTVTPDLDKLARAVADALTIAGVISDDSRIVNLALSKRYAKERPGADIQVMEIQW